MANPSRRHTVASQDITDRLIADLVPQIGQRPGDPVVAPITVLFGHANDEIFTLAGDPRSAWAAAPERKRTTTWPAFVRTHLALLAGTDFFTAEVLTLRGLVTYYVLLFIHLESRQVAIAEITVHPDELWMKQIARNVTMEGYGILRNCRYLLHDRDTKYTRSFRAIIASGQVEPLALPARCPNLNAFAERWVRSVKEECLSKVVLFGERSLRRALREYVEHYHAERNHQGKGNVLCSLVIRTSARRRLYSAASDWVGFCAITITRQHSRTPKVQSRNLTPPLRSRDRGKPAQHASLPRFPN